MFTFGGGQDRSLEKWVGGTGGANRICDGAAKAGDERACLTVCLSCRSLEDHRLLEIPSSSHNADTCLHVHECRSLKDFGGKLCEGSRFCFCAPAPHD